MCFFFNRKASQKHHVIFKQIIFRQRIENDSFQRYSSEWICFQKCFHTEDLNCNCVNCIQRLMLAYSQGRTNRLFLSQYRASPSCISDFCTRYIVFEISCMQFHRVFCISLTSDCDASHDWLCIKLAMRSLVKLKSRKLQKYISTEIQNLISEDYVEFISQQFYISLKVCSFD